MAATTSRALACLLAGAMGVLAPAGGLARAQDGSARGVSAEDRRSAAEAYDRGTAAYLAREFGRAAQWFETAHRLAPAAAALTQAVRAHGRAGNELRAATLALRLDALYPDDRAARRTARQALQASDRLFRVDVECGGCTLTVDGALVEHSSFFLQPETEHELVASFDTGDVRERLSGAAGQARTVTLQAPEPDPVATAEPEPPVGQEPPAGSELAGPEPGPIPAWLTLGAMVVTAGLGATLVWSGVDTLDGVPAYEMNPTAAGLADGQAREERTNWLIAGTSVAAAATLVLALLTDWSFGSDGGSRDGARGDRAEGVEVRADLGVELGGSQGQRLTAGLRGRF